MRSWRKIVRRGITRRPGRTIFSVLSIIIGVMLLTGISLATSSWKYSEQISYVEANMADFVVYTESLPQNITNILANLSNVRAVEGRLFISTTLNYPPNYIGVQTWLFGVDVPLELDRVKVVEGLFFSQNHEEALVAEYSYFTSITMGQPIGEEIEIVGPLGNRSLPIVGTFKSMWVPPYGAGAPPILLIPIRTAQELFGFEGELNSLLVQVTDKSKLSATLEEAKTTLKDYRILSVVYEGKILPQFTFEPYLIGLTNSLRIVGVLTILVGTALVYNILDLAVSEEYREIGTFKALGFTNRQVLSVYMVRGLLLGVIGSVIGAFLGLWLGSILLGQYTTPAGLTHALLEIDYIVMFAYTGLGTCLVALCSLPSALRAYSVVPYLAISQGREITSQRPPKSGTSRLFGGIIPGGYAIRSLLNKKSRVIGMVTILIISTMLYATSLTATQTFKGNVDYYFDHEFPVDMNINIWPEPDLSNLLQVDKTLNIIRNVEGVGIAEPLMGGLVWSKGFSVTAIGMLPNTVFRPSMLQGEWFTNNESVAIASEFVAREMNLHVGENLTLSTLRMVPNNITVKVIGIARELLANVIFLPLEKTQELFSFPGMAIVAVKVEDGYDISSVAGKISNVIRCFPWSKLQMRQAFDSMVINTYIYVMDITILLASIFSLLMISTIVMMNVNERRREFAILKAVGVTPDQIRNSVLIEILVIGAIGGCLGIVLSIVFVFTFIEATSTILFSVRFMVFPFENIAKTVALLLFTSLLSGLIPALSASRTRTAEALRYE